MDNYQLTNRLRFMCIVDFLVVKRGGGLVGIRISLLK